MSTYKLFGKDILITSTTEATSNTVGAFSTLGGISATKTILTAGGINSLSNTNTLGNLFTTGGNIGIGTTAPVQRLDVNGNLNITGNFYQNGSVYSGSTQWGSTGANIYFNTGNVGIGTLAPAYTLDVNGTIDASEYTGGNMRISGTMGSSVVDIGGNEVFRLSRPTGYKLIQTYQSEPLVLNILGNNVGINTTSPIFKLDINGTLRASGPGGTGTNGSALITGADSYGHSLYVASSSGTQKRVAFNHTGTIGNIFAYDYSSVGGGPLNLILQGPGGNVGIGINNPTSKLHVDGTVSATGLTNIPSFCYINGTGTISNPNSLLFNGSVHIDNKSGFNATTGKYTVPMTGFYSVSFNVRLNDSTASGAVVIATTRSATTTYTVDVWIPLDPANRRCASYTRLMSLISGDIIFITMSPNSSPGSVSGSEMSVHLVSIA